jgi:hypothetical protein
MLDWHNLCCASCPFQKNLGRIVIPDFGATIEANDQRGMRDLTEGKPQMGAVDGPEGARAADVG